eukprot:TRINITY_DN5185_c0_g1_i1.p1 TRINITY_DN5185_c0_g1~~TRINITY_DN5185_c0_g1_i1.p1  ORF type:complete len:910 (+),score=325.71 TRINITY_DN5185_c0_g1_i1:30-2759(+)
MSDFISLYRNFPSKPKNCIRFFDRRDFFTVYGEDAIFIASTYNKTTGTVKYIGGESQLASQTIQSRLLNSILKDLVDKKNYSFEIWANKKQTWECVRKGSPGNFENFDYEGEGEGEGNLIMAVNIGREQNQILIGIAYVDQITNQFGVSQFVDDNKLSNLESSMVQLGAKEILISLNETKFPIKDIKNVFERCDVVLTEQKQKSFKTSNIEQDLKRLLNADIHPTISTSELELTLAMGSLSSLILYLELINDDTNHGVYTLIRFDLKQYMKLDSAAVQALNLVPTATDGNKNMNLYGRLNYCKTAMGSRKLLQWIKQPLIDQEKICERQNVVEIFFDDTALRETIQKECLNMVPDLHKLSKKFQKGKAGLQDCVRLYQFVRDLPKLLQAITDEKHNHILLVKLFSENLQQVIIDFQNYEDMIEKTIDLNSFKENNEYKVKPNFSDELKELDGILRAINQKMRDEEYSIKNKLTKVKKLELDHKKGYGYCFRCAKSGEKEVKKVLGAKEVEVVASQKNGFYFRTTQLRKLSEKYEKASSSYNTEQQKLVKQILEIALGYMPIVDEVANIISTIDVYVSLAHAATIAPGSYVKPTLSPPGTGDTILKGMRHPCIEVQDGVQFIPNDVSLIRGVSEFILITGPNMGGKSTYIRSVGMIVLMAQIGSFVPCTSATVSISDSILTRVGAGDSQLRGISTFMAEMLGTVSILKNATEKSLLIIDELGRGTSTYDGFGLAWSISEYICEKLKSFCFFATHFHELTELEKFEHNVKNCHVTAMTENEELVLLYNIKEGPCDQSFGIQVAELAGFPPQVIQVAKRKALELENFDTKNDKEMFEKFKKQKFDENYEEKEDEEDEEIKERDLIISNFLDKFKDIPINEMSNVQILDTLNKMKKEIENTNNGALKEFLNSI